MLLQSVKPVKSQGQPQAGKATDTTNANGKQHQKADTAVDSGPESAAGGRLQAEAETRDSSKTVFVRALPPDVSQDQLHLTFKKFGKLRACRYAP